MDASFRIPYTNIRFGWDSLIGLIPGVGDLVTTIISIYIVAKAQRLGISSWTMARMGLNILIDSGMGALPLVGDVFDLFYKSNQRNIRLLEKALANPKRQKLDRLFGIAFLTGLFGLAIGFMTAVGYLVVRLLDQLLMGGS